MKTTIMPNECRRFVSEVMMQLKCDRMRAERWAELLVETSLLGFDSHGIRMLDRYVRFIQGGGMDPAADVSVEMDDGACMKLNGNGGMGHLVADRAADLALELAGRNGIACVTARNSNHVGACALYTRKAALNGFIGICATVSRPGMAPWGGKQAMLGLNPISIAAPAEGKHPFLLDMATSVTAMGKITEASDHGKSIPESWALDGDGNPTTDPDKAISGTLLPIGGYKGSGLAMALEIISALLGGGNFALDVRSWIQQTEKPMESSFIFIALDISKWQPLETFRVNLASWLNLITASPLREGFERICYPGEMAGEHLVKRTADGIPIDAKVEAMFEALSAEFSIQKPDFQAP